MRRYDVIAEICDAMLALGWGAYQNDHEDANGQFEMNWAFDDVLATADQHSFFKFMVKSIAEKHGLRATFMPKPFQDLTGNGCHVHVSVWDKDGKTNVFEDNGVELGLSSRGRHFLGGIMHHADALCRDHQPDGELLQAHQCAARRISGATWSPNTVTWTGNNRTHMVRVPGPGRFELQARRRRRQPLSAAGGDHGRRARRHPPQARSRPSSSTSTCTRTGTHGDAWRKNCRSTCSTRCASSTPISELKSALGEEFSCRLPEAEAPGVERLRLAISREWEIDNTMDI